MKRRNLRLYFLRAAASKGLSRALVASLILFGSSCSSARQFASQFDNSRKAGTKDPFVKSDGDVTHADLVTKSTGDVPVTPLAHEVAAEHKNEANQLDSVPTQAVAVVAAVSPDSPDTDAAPSDLPVSPTAVVESGPGKPAGPRCFPTFAEKDEPLVHESSVQQVSHEALHGAADSATEAAVHSAASPDTERKHPLDGTEATANAQPDAPGSLVAVVAHADEPRVPLDCPAGNCPPEQCPSAAGPNPFPPPSTIGDEYLCDGGDKGLPVGPHGPLQARLDPEDTVAQYTDHLGHEHVEASNETCVYAPRFAAVRTVSEPLAGHAVDRAAGTHEGTPLAGLRTRTVLDEEVQRERPQGARTWSRASGMEGELTDESLVKDESHRLHVKLQGPLQAYGFIRDGQLDKVDVAFLQQAIEAGFDWSGQQAPAIYASDQSGQEVDGQVLAQDMTGVEDRRTVGRLTLVKVADRKSAQPGDVVTFTLRFDNTGDRELLNVRVVDNLTNRLRLVDGSVQSNANGNLSVEPNGSGGTILKFEFTDPLPGRTGGYITFQCTVL